MKDEIKMTISRKYLVVGLARDCAGNLRSDIERIKHCLGQGNHIQWLIVESDSEDDTVSILGRLRSEISEFTFVSLGPIRKSFPLRTARLAYCRNLYIEALGRDSRYRDVEYVVITDLDGTNSSLTANSIESCWARDDWDVCFANQDGPYYDIWALRHEKWSPDDCHEKYQQYINQNYPHWKAYYHSIYKRMITIDQSASWIEVESAFGGLAIYKRKVLENTQYVGLTAENREICEHVSVNKQIKEKGYRLFLNPRLINTSITTHYLLATIKLLVLFLKDITLISRFNRSFLK